MKFNKIEKQMLVLELLKGINGIFLSTFLLAFFINVSIDNINQYALLNIATYLSAGFGSILVCKIIKRRNKLNMYRLGLIVSLLYLFCIVILREEMVNYCIPLGILYGISLACYYMPFNYMVANGIRDEVRTKYMGYKNSLIYFFNIIVPIILGYYLLKFDYSSIAVAFIIISFVQLLFTFIVKYKSKSTNKYSLIKYHNVIKESGYRKYFTRNYIYQFLLGFAVADSSIKSLVTIFIILMFKTNMNLGIFTSIFSLITLIVTYVFGRTGHRRYFKSYSLVSSVLVVLSILLFVIVPTKVTFTIYSLVFTVGIAILAMISNVITMDSANISDIKRNYQLEYLGVRELALCLGRVLSYILLFTVSFYTSITFMKILLVFMSVMILLVSLIAGRVKRD